jgi:hypothetical protein
MKNFVLAGLVGVGLTAAASASGFSGALDGGFNYSRADGDGNTGYDGNAALQIAFGDPGFALQFGGSSGRSDIDDGHINQRSGNGHFFWRDAKGAIGFSGSYTALEVSGNDIDAYQYGAFGEWYARPDLTLRLRGGRTVLDNGESDKHSGWYGGVGAAYYVDPDFSFSVRANYLEIKNAKDTQLGAAAEYQLSHQYPLSLAIDYQYRHNELYGDGGNASTAMFRIKYRFGLSGALVDLDRTGPLVWSALSL